MLNEVKHLRDPTHILRCAQDDVRIVALFYWMLATEY